MKYLYPYLSALIVALTLNLIVSMAQTPTENYDFQGIITDSLSFYKQSASPKISYDTLDGESNMVVNFGIGLTFPLQDFHSTDVSNPVAGYALTGNSLNVSFFQGFTDKSEAGWLLGLSYHTFRMSTSFVDFLNDSLAQYQPENVPLDPSVQVAADYTPRYHMWTFQTGLAFEGSNPELSVYGHLLLNLNVTDINTFKLSNDPLNNREVNTSMAFNFGYSAAFGFRFQNQLMVGVSWHNFGTTSLQMNLGGSRPPGIDGTFPTFLFDRQIHFFEINLGYSIIKR